MFVFSIILFYLILDKSTIYKVLSAVIVLDKGIIPVERNSIGLQFYVNIENIDPWSSCRIHSWPKMCCLEDEPYKDCYIDTIYGDNIDSIIPKRRETLIYVYPTMYQHDLVGYCDFVIDFRCGRQKRSVQLDVNIPFNTNLNDKKTTDYLKEFSGEKKSKCGSLDEDSLGDCAPVNCDLKYSGRRPFFDVRRSKCVSAPDCKTDIYKELPDVAYVPISNTCRDLSQAITLNDVYSIRTGVGVVTRPINSKTKRMKVLVTSNCSTISENMMLLKDLLTGRLCNLFRDDSTAYDACCINAILSICACIVAISALLISIICCIHSTIWLAQKVTAGRLKNFYHKYKDKVFGRKDIKQQPSRLCRDVTNNLLREVIVRDIPIELRDSVVEICERIGKEVGRKKRYRMLDLGNQVNLETESESASSSGRSHHEEEH